MSLIKRKLGESFSLKEQTEGYSPEHLLTDVQRQTKGLIDLALEQIQLALLHDSLSINEDSFNRWLTDNCAKIQIVCQEIWSENQEIIRTQASELEAIHHTPAHAQDVSKRANHLFSQLEMSTSQSPRNQAYAAIRDLFIKSHDLIQGKGQIYNEVETQQTLFRKLIEKLEINIDQQPDIYHMLDVMGHRLIVLGTSLIFDEQVFDLAQLYLETQRFFGLHTPFEVFSQEMLITGLCDRAPASCEELVHMVYENPLGLKEHALQTLHEGNPLLQFLEGTRAEKPYPYLNKAQNLMAFLIAMSPHQGMSIELCILPKAQHQQTLFELKELLTESEQSFQLEDFILVQTDINNLKEKEKNKAIISTEQLRLKKHQLAQRLIKHNKALALRAEIVNLKTQIWHPAAQDTEEHATYQTLITQYNDTSKPISKADIDLKDCFESVFIENLASEVFFSQAQEASLLFLASEFKSQLHINPNVAYADVHNMSELASYYSSLNQHQQIQFMYELLFPLVCQMGEFYMAQPYFNQQVNYQNSMKYHCASPLAFWQQASTTSPPTMESKPLKDQPEGSLRTTC